MKNKIFLLSCCFFACMLLQNCNSSVRSAKGSASGQEVPKEVNGLLVVEAENFATQTNTDVRQWYRVDKKNQPEIMPDADPPHFATASGGAYLEILPDTRTTHADKLIRGENFTNLPEGMGTLTYPVEITNPGRYYVWVRAYTTGTEDNGIHVGLDGEWVPTGHRMQFDGKSNEWRWGSRQRTEEVHTGVEKLIYLDIPTAGRHEIMFCMREDGFEFDKFALTKEYKAPID